MSNEPTPSKRRKGLTELAIPAGLFIGIGIGLLVDNVAAGILIGLGAGFLLTIVLRAIAGEW